MNKVFYFVAKFFADLYKQCIRNTSEAVLGTVLTNSRWSRGPLTVQFSVETVSRNRPSVYSNWIGIGSVEIAV